MKCNSDMMRQVGVGLCQLVGVLFFLYFFLVALDIMGNAFVVLTGDSAGSLFGSVDNPIAALMVGILATVLCQSSSTTTSITVAMAGSGVITLQQGIFLIMGANVGTSVTNTIVAMGFFRNREQMRLGFAGATVHDCFNLIAVAFWLPVEWIGMAITGDLGPLGMLSELVTFDECNGDDCESWSSPLKAITSPLVKLIIDANKDVIEDYAQGRPSQDFCATRCDVTNNTSICEQFKFADKRCANAPLDLEGVYGACAGSGAIIDEETGEIDTKVRAAFAFCTSVQTSLAAVLDAAQEHYDAARLLKGGFMYEAGWSDIGAGIFALILSLAMLLLCLMGLVKVLGAVLQGRTQEVVRKILNLPGPLAIIAGALFTMFVQSSSITTSVLTPLVALGTVDLKSMLPLTLGANIGTTITGILASMVSDSQLGFQIAMVHVFFNVFSVCMLYPIPFLRHMVLAMATKLGEMAAAFQLFPIFYLCMVFFVWPLVLLATSIGFTSGEPGPIAGGVVGLLCFIALHVAVTFWYKRKGGKRFLLSRFGRKYEDEQGSESPDTALSLDKEEEFERDQASPQVEVV